MDMAVRFVIYRKCYFCPLRSLPLRHISSNSKLSGLCLQRARDLSL